MNQFMAAGAVRFAGAAQVGPAAPASSVAVERAALAPGRFVSLGEPPPVLPASLPLASSQSGNLFVDRNDASLHWYLPGFTLAADVDSAFAFAASQSGQDAAGNPFNTAKLTLGMLKVQPPDVAQFIQANPAARVQEIPLLELAAVLTSAYLDDGGQELQRTFTGALQDLGGGAFLVTFGPILGASVAGFYQDLTSFGKASIALTASYQVWSGTPFVPNRILPLRFVAPPEGLVARPTFIRQPMAFEAAQPAAVAPVLRVRAFGPPAVQVAQPPAPTLVQTRQNWEATLPLGLKYQQDGYQLRYTVSTATVANHVIRDARDLKDFSLAQSEFKELKALAHFNDRYPSLSRLFIGTLSRTIVAIPQRYSIVRSRLGCSAACMALLDSGAADGSKCVFEFDFVVAPEVSRVEVQRLTQEIAARPELQGYRLAFPDFLRTTPPSALQTTFQSDVAFSAGADPHTFALSVSIHDESAQTPAVANANLFIMRLCAASGVDLVGSLSLKLDDGYPDPVLSTLDLNFAHTSGADDELAVQFDEAATQIQVTNQSPLDLLLSRYALIQPAALTEVPANISIPAAATADLPLPADHAGLSFAADAQLVVPAPMKKPDVARFLHFQTADVQNTQYVVAVSAAGVDFKRVDSIVASITFDNLPGLIPRDLSLNANVFQDSTHILVPLENAVFSLPGTVRLRVHFVDPASADVSFTLENDFTVTPTLILLQSDIDKAVPAP